MSLNRLQKCVEKGISIIIGTVDADGVPSTCRAIALNTRDNFDSVTVYVPAATSQETLANVATTRRVAVVCTAPLSHESVQIKGVTRGVRLAPATDQAFVADRLEGFADVLQEIGLPRRVTRSMAHWPAFAIDVSVEEVFEQTPGPKAGTPLA
ncbi:MAG TPA: hypothetical protein VJZ00_24860 [Thermoanaerobaculia bacterium]|nr:hypothetical protein [Thermoanaerobaculia bacterium]